jgi:hydroxymethylbilane synthase
MSDKGVFVRAIEEALLEGAIDAAVHSLKDVPAEHEQPTLELAAFSSREDPRDVVLSHLGNLMDLPVRSTVGTSSPRRILQLAALRPDLTPAEIRGNVETRIRKLDDGEYDALILAAAGVRRLGLAARVTEYLDPATFVPDAGQGIITVQVRRGDRVGELVRSIDDSPSRTCATAERAVVRALRANCRSPVGAYAYVRDDRLSIVAIAARAADAPLCRDQAEGAPQEAASLGWALGERLLNSILTHG